MDAFGFEQANDDFVEDLHTDVSLLFTHDLPAPALRAVMKELGCAHSVEQFEVWVPAGLQATLASDKPPKWGLFKIMPSAREMREQKLLHNWCAACMEHPGGKLLPRLCIGSASAALGAQVRIGQWLQERQLPSKVERFMQKGFEVVHIGILMIIKKNGVREHALGRLWALTNEARFTWRFWSRYQKERASKSGHHYAEKLRRWNVDDL
jgi:hypothetical protein